MARNSELIRQWDILREIDGARTGVSVQKLAALRDVHQRTIRRDIEALSRAGFPLYDERINGTTMWRLRAKPFRGLEDTGLGLSELCALYFSRTLIEAVAGAPFLDDLERAILKIERALPVASRKFLDRLSTMLKAKTTGRKRVDEKKTRDILTRAVDASVRHRRVAMRYDSAASQRTKDYTVDPLRLSYAHGGIYLSAWVDEYQQLRTFAMERIRTLAVLDEQFEPRPLPAEPFANSLGVHTGPPEAVEIEFDQQAAQFICEREWHRSQQIETRRDGSLIVRLNVCNDRPLRRWILGFGSLARVVSPAHLAEAIATEMDQARTRYLPSKAHGVARMAMSTDREAAREQSRAS